MHLFTLKKKKKDLSFCPTVTYNKTDVLKKIFSMEKKDIFPSLTIKFLKPVGKGTGKEKKYS